LGGLSEERFFSDDVSHNLQMHYRWWLFHEWYGSQPLSLSSAPKLQKKARSMVMELGLTIRCQELNIDVEDPFDTRRDLRFLDRAARWSRRNLPIPAASARVNG
jgi:hypothetical protein